jgi:hypothetical protein
MVETYHICTATCCLHLQGRIICSVHHRKRFYSEDGDNKLFRNVGAVILVYAAKHPIFVVTNMSASNIDRFPVRNDTHTPVILSDGFPEFPQSTQTNYTNRSWPLIFPFKLSPSFNVR